MTNQHLQVQVARVREEVAFDAIAKLQEFIAAHPNFREAEYC